MSAEFDSFLNLYHVAFKKLLKRLEKLPKNERISVEKYVQQLVDEAVSSLNQNLLDHIPTIVNSSYVDGAKAVTTALGKTSGTIGTTLNTRLMRLLAENTVDQLQEAHHLFGRRTMDRVRDIGIAVVGEGLAGERNTRREIAKQLQTELERDGMQFIPTSDGRKMDLRSYSQMVAVTTAREATNTGAIETTKDLGYDLLRCTETATSCAVCAAVMGRIYSISGEDERFDALSSVPGFDKGFKTIHPNCKHNFVPVVWELLDEDEQEAALKRAHQPFDKDPRTKAMIDQYNADQKAKRDRWNDRRQWERYKAVLKEEAPKSFSDFRRIKRSRPSEFAELQKSYRIVNRYEVIGDVPVCKIVELDQAAYITKRNGFDETVATTRKERRYVNRIKRGLGNAAIMEFEGKTYFSHSQFDTGSKDDLATQSYIGKYPIVGLLEEKKFDDAVIQDKTGKIDRRLDTEAKFFEFVAKNKAPSDKFTITILSEKHICISCTSVMNAFKQDYPNATVNVISGKRGYNGDAEGNSTWKHRP